MPNPFSALNPNDPMAAYRADIPNLQRMYQAVMGGGDPMRAFSGLAEGNPRMAPILQALRQGGDPRAIFSSLCRQRGIDPREFMRRITGNDAF